MFKLYKLQILFTKHLKILQNNGKFPVNPEKVLRGALYNQIYLKQKAKADLNKVKFG